jgi:hypothetical protein
MRFCCRAFEYWYGMAGTRGFGAFAAENGNTPTTFVIQHRALDNDATPPAFSPSPLSLVSDLIIQFCPWCGTKLDEFYRGHEQHIDRTNLKLL